MATILSAMSRLPTGLGPIMDLRGRLREELPDYMVPAQIMRLDRFRVPRNGKIDRKSLPVPQTTAWSGSSWRRGHRLKQSSQISGGRAADRRSRIHDNLFALGADSIDLFRIAARMRGLGFNLDAADLMRHRRSPNWR